MKNNPMEKMGMTPSDAKKEIEEGKIEYKERSTGFKENLNKIMKQLEEALGEKITIIEVPDHLIIRDEGYENGINTINTVGDFQNIVLPMTKEEYEEVMLGSHDGWTEQTEGLYLARKILGENKDYFDYIEVSVKDNTSTSEISGKWRSGPHYQANIDKETEIIPNPAVLVNSYRESGNSIDYDTFQVYIKKQSSVSK